MKLSLASFQWMIFILANSIVAPLSVGAAFHMSGIETAELIQRTFFVTGLSSLLQVLFGHKLPIMDGPAGLWWGVFLIFAGFAASSSSPNGTHEVLQSLEMGLLISGGLFIALSMFRLIPYIKKIFTPTVSGTYLILLVAQMSGAFAKGILGINYMGPGVEWKIAVPAVIVLIVSIGLAYSRFVWVRSYSVLLGIGFGWVLFILLDLGKPVLYQSVAWFSLPTLMAWGEPRFNIGILLTSIITGLLLLTNLITSIEVIGKLVEESSETGERHSRSSLVMGINQVLSGLFSTIGFVPVAFTAGFIMTTKMTQKLPFIIGSCMILAVSFFPAVTSVFSSIPFPVGYAVTFLTFSNLVGLGLKEYASKLADPKQTLIIGISFMTGIGCLFITPEALTRMPAFIVTLLNNGLLMGVVVCILLEQGSKLKEKLKGGKISNAAKNA